MKPLPDDLCMTHRRLLPLLATPLLLGAAATGQTPPSVRALPAIATDAYAGGVTLAIPPGPFRSQHWFAGANLPNGTLIRRLGIRTARGTVTKAAVREVEGFLANVSKGFDQLDRTFANNLGASPVRFFARRRINWPAISASTDPNRPLLWFPGDRPFMFRGPHLVIDARVGPVLSGARDSIRNDSFVMGVAAPTLHLSGRPGCAGSLNAAHAGGVFSLRATGAVPGSPVTFQLGFDVDRLGPTPLPIDLGILGMRGCHLGLAPIATATATASASGDARLSARLDLPSRSAVLAAQAVLFRVFPPRSLADLATTNTTQSILGSAGLANDLYADGADPKVAQAGPFAHNHGVVLLVD